VVSDPTGDGFYIIATHKYDESILCVHSHREQNLFMKELIEPGIIRYLDIATGGTDSSLVF